VSTPPSSAPRDPSPPVDADAAPSAPSAPKGPLSARERRVRAAVYAVYGAFATAFVILSTWQIIAQVFGFTAAPLTAGVPAPPSTAGPCAEGIRAFSAALDRGVAASSTARTEAEALAQMRAAMPEWEREAAIASTCGADPRGAEAWAALLRLRRAEEGAAGRRVVDVAAVRRDVEAYVGPDRRPQ
jgi:hypothetical protein